MSKREHHSNRQPGNRWGDAGNGMGIQAQRQEAMEIILKTQISNGKCQRDTRPTGMGMLQRRKGSI